ncbi:MAG: M50 family metallopeptidase [Desulfuromonadaceae bacterium]|nr:M50 family metallopeptidase [Desulfuromonadaceae bacterium]
MIFSQSLHSPYLITGFLTASVVMGAIHRRLSASGSFIAVLYSLPFTCMHEMSHFVAAFITGGRPSAFSIRPRKSGNGWVLGSVNSVPTLLSAAPTALAPLGWLVIGYYSMALWDIRPVWMPESLLVVILYACAAACTPSRQDITVALTHPFSLLLWVAIAYIVVTMSHSLQGN